MRKYNLYIYYSKVDEFNVMHIEDDVLKFATEINRNRFNTRDLVVLYLQRKTN